MTGNGFLVADGETLNLEFLVKIRLMLDHKYKDFLLQGYAYKQNSKMVEYAYWWLGKFTVDSQTMGLINKGEYDFFNETQRIMYPKLTQIPRARLGPQTQQALGSQYDEAVHGRVLRAR